MPFSVRLNHIDGELIKSYAKLKGRPVGQLMKEALIEKIEDEYDLESFYEAKKEFSKDPAVYTLDEVKKELGLK